MTFSDAVLMAGDSFQKIGRLAPGASASISLAVKAANPFGGSPLYTRIYSNTTFGPPPSNPTPADREGQARTPVAAWGRFVTSNAKVVLPVAVVAIGFVVLLRGLTFRERRGPASEAEAPAEPSEATAPSQPSDAATAEEPHAES